MLGYDALNDLMNAIDPRKPKLNFRSQIRRSSHRT
jgi:hypothetical protein